MTMRDSVDILAGVPLVVVIPAMVEVLKQNGLPTRLAGVAAMCLACVLMAIADVALDGVPSGDVAVMTVAHWLVAGMVYGLAASGLYTQVRRVGAA